MKFEREIYVVESSCTGTPMPFAEKYYLTRESAQRYVAAHMKRYPTEMCFVTRYLPAESEDEWHGEPH